MFLIIVQRSQRRRSSYQTFSRSKQSEPTAAGVVPKSHDFVATSSIRQFKLNAEDYQDRGVSMITIGSLARVIVSGNHRFRSCLRKLLLSLGNHARIGAPP